MVPPTKRVWMVFFIRDNNSKNPAYMFSFGSTSHKETLRVEVYTVLTIKPNLVHSFDKFLVKINRPNYSMFLCRMITEILVIILVKIFSFLRVVIFPTIHVPIIRQIWSISRHLNNVYVFMFDIPDFMYLLSENMLPYIAEFLHSYWLEEIITCAVLNSFHDLACFTVYRHHCAGSQNATCQKQGFQWMWIKNRWEF